MPGVWGNAVYQLLLLPALHRRGGECRQDRWPHPSRAEVAPSDCDKKLDLKVVVQVQYALCRYRGLKYNR